MSCNSEFENKTNFCKAKINHYISLYKSVKLKKKQLA